MRVRARTMRRMVSLPLFIINLTTYLVFLQRICHTNSCSSPSVVVGPVCRIMLAIIINLPPTAMNFDKEEQFPINFCASNQSERLSNFLGFRNNSDPSESLGPNQEKAYSQSNSDFEVSLQEARDYFNLLFSPQPIVQSLNKRNQTLEMKLLQYSDSQPDQIYYNRVQRMKKLTDKEKRQSALMEEMQEQDQERYKAISHFMRLFASIKQTICGIRSDYYSNKVLTTLQKAPVPILQRITKVLYQMYWAIMNEPLRNQSMLREGSKGEKVDGRLVEFLIIPRFMISKDKLQRLADDETLQENFKFLISHGCLGHYNNEANKKLPEETHMEYIRSIMCRADGREKYKRLCSINHGGKFIKENGEELYHDIFFKPLECLQLIDEKLKKKQKFVAIRDQVNSFPNEMISSPDSQAQAFTPIFDNNIIGAKSVSKYLFSNFSRSVIEQPLFTKTSQIETEERDKRKFFGMRKSASMIPEMEDPFETSRLKRPLTFQHSLDNSFKQPNIILVPTPQEYSIHQI